MRVCVRACVCACVRACVRACVSVCVKRPSSRLRGIDRLLFLDSAAPHQIMAKKGARSRLAANNARLMKLGGLLVISVVSVKTKG